VAGQDFKGFLITFVLLSIFIVALINFSVQFANDTGSNNSIIDHPSISILNSTVTANLSGAQGLAQGQRNNVEKDTPIIAFDFLLSSIVGTWRIFNSVTFNIINVIADVSHNVLGVPPIVIGGVLSIMLITVIYLGWKMIKTGQ